MTLSTKSKLFLSHFLAIVLVSGSIGSYFYHSAIDALLLSLQTRLKYSAALASHAISGEGLAELQTADDMQTAQYRNRVAQLQSMVASNPDIAFIYVMRKENGRAVFVYDSDETDPAMSGELYKEDIPELLLGFDKASADEDITRDRWGSFMSGYAPINSNDGNYLIGIDMRADEVDKKLSRLHVTGIASLLLSILLAFIFSHFISRQQVSRINNLHQYCLQLDKSVLENTSRDIAGDELDKLSDTLYQLLNSLEKSRQEMDQRIKSRTAELEDSNQHLKNEINERKRMTGLLQETLRTDSLTNLINRRHMQQILQHEQTRLMQTETASSLLLLDIDHFHKINEQFGEETGDALLEACARQLEDCSPTRSLIARWDSNAFLILLPNSHLQQAMNHAEGIRHCIETNKLYAANQPHHLTLSISVAELHKNKNVSNTLKGAAIALNTAKKNGRNRVIAADVG